MSECGHELCWQGECTEVVDVTPGSTTDGTYCALKTDVEDEPLPMEEKSQEVGGRHGGDEGDVVPAVQAEQLREQVVSLKKQLKETREKLTAAEERIALQASEIARLKEQPGTVTGEGAEASTVQELKYVLTSTRPALNRPEYCTQGTA